MRGNNITSSVKTIAERQGITFENDQSIILKWIDDVDMSDMDYGEIVIVCQSFKNWFDNGVRDLNVGSNYKNIRKFARCGVIVNSTSLPLIYNMFNLSDEDFDIIVSRILICQQNGVIINNDSLSVIRDLTDLSLEEFQEFAKRMLICQQNGVSCSLVRKSCKKTSK